MALFDFSTSSDSVAQAMEVLAKMGIGALLGGAIGWEREAHGRPAGMRTHIMLVIGVVLMCEVSKVFGGGDPSRIAAQIVTGVGFLGAGAIMRMGTDIKGLTSAASLWAATGIAMAISVAGPYLIVAIVATALAIFTLEVLSKFERKIFPNTRRELVVMARFPADLPPILQGLLASGHKVAGSRILQTDPVLEVAIELMGPSDRALQDALATPGTTSARWSDA